MSAQREDFRQNKIPPVRGGFLSVPYVGITRFRFGGFTLRPNGHPYGLSYYLYVIANRPASSFYG